MPQIDIDGANSRLSADNIRGQSGSTITIVSGHNLVGSGSGLTALPAANLTGTIAAISGANLTNLNATNLASGTVPTARLGSGTANSSVHLRGDGTWAAVAAGGGKILQVVESTSIDATYLNTTTFADIDLAVTITPSATTSKILVFGGFGYYKNSDGYLYATLYRDSTELSGDADGISKSYSHADGGDSTYVQYLDSPSSTSALVYSLSMRLSNTPTVYINCNYLTCLEIGV